MTSLFGVPLDAAYHLAAGLTGFLTPVFGGVAAVAAIIALTVAVRIILMPLSFRALRGQAAAARLAPQLQALRARYARQPERLQSEMAALQSHEGTSMFAGLTPLLAQWPVFSVIYLLFRSAKVGGKANTLFRHHLLGVALGAHWLGGAGPVSMQGLVFACVFALLAGLCWLSSRLARAMTAQATAFAGGKAAPAVAAPPAPVPGGALLKAFAYLTVLIVAFAPLATGIYLVVSTGWSLAERGFFYRSGRLACRPRRRAGRAAGRNP
jgi:YidC/Oxa1 family membrane protein insertase